MWRFICRENTFLSFFERIFVAELKTTLFFYYDVIFYEAPIKFVAILFIFRHWNELEKLILQQHDMKSCYKSSKLFSMHYRSVTATKMSQLEKTVF